MSTKHHTTRYHGTDDHRSPDSADRRLESIENRRCVPKYATLGGALLVVSISATACSDQKVDTSGQHEAVASTRQAFTPSECPADVDAPIRKAVTKYNLPRWFYYAVVHRESTFNKNLQTGSGTCCTGYGLTQLTNPDHTGIVYPENLPNYDQSNTTWQTNMRISHYCTWICPWIDMQYVSPLPNSDSWKDPDKNLDRYSSGYAAPAYRVFRAKYPSDSVETTLRRVAYHWRYGLFEPPTYPNDPGHYFDGAYGYDAYVSAYKGPVEAEDGVWTGPTCAPPYSASGCTSPDPEYSSTATSTPSCLVAGSGASTAIEAQFTNTNSKALTSGVVDIEVWDDATKIDQGYDEGRSISAGATRSFTWNWTAPATVPAPSKSYTIKLGVFGQGWAPNHHWNDSAGTITVSADNTKYNFECGSSQD